MPALHVVVLAAGKGTRMKSAQPKVLHPAAGLPLIEHVLRVAAALQPETITVIVGHGAAAVQRAIGERSAVAQGLAVAPDAEGKALSARRQPDVRFALQEPQLGTGHALLQAHSYLPDGPGTVLLLSGDVPLLRLETVRRLLDRHVHTGAAATVLTAHVPDPDGYGRIVRHKGAIAAIVEHRDATAEERAINEINSGVYAFDLPPLFGALTTLGSGNAQGEYYLPDLVRIYRARGLGVETVTVQDEREIMGVNSRRELADVNAILKAARADELMAAGVTIVDPASTFIGPDVTVGPDTVLYPNVYLEGRTTIGSGCEIQACVRLVDTVVEDRAVIQNFCVIFQSRIRAGAQIGPFAHLRPDSEVGEDAKVGNFVELKKTRLGRGSKASHLSYLGDSTIGEKVNIGAGTITCNYDGRVKSATVIEDNAFIGSDTQLIAPVRVGRGAYVAAGSSITDDVPAGALGIARGKQVNKEGWVERKKKDQR
jgi:bifunctional UDP-N-acetylglucosamine pyrophosphorylase/glucosamine-1-phosphate N-acetyltransferase